MDTVVIRPPRGWLNLRLRELWHFRELFLFLVWRDVKVRYKQTVLGASWAVLQPTLLMVVFSIFLGRLVNVPSNGVPYPIFAFAALVPWTLFAQSVTGSTLSLVGSANLVSKIYFPRILLPVAATGSFVVDFLIAFAVLIGMMLYYDIVPGTRVLWIPLLALFAVITALAVGIWTAALNARYRDVQYAIPFLVQVWLFVSPVGYPSSLLDGNARLLFGLNPMAGVVEGFRWALLETETAPGSLMIVSALVTIMVFISGVTYFQRVEQTFADVI